MRAPVLIILTGLALAAAACATVEAPAESDSAVVSSGAPAPVAGHDWFYHRDGDGARLVYGLGESDDLRLGLDCSQGSGRLTLSALGGPDARPEIHVEAGGEAQRFAAQSEPSELHEGVLLTAEAAANAPVFQRFRRVGWLALWSDGERQAYAPHPESAPNIERFFAFCG